MLENKLSRVGVGEGCGGGGRMAGLTENKTKPSSLGLAELGNYSCIVTLVFNKTKRDLFDVTSDDNE